MTITTKSHVLLVCPEPLGHRQPAGVGIRFLEFAKLLTREGYTVTLLSRDSATHEGCRAGGLDAESIRSASLDAEVIVVQGHAANEVFEFAAVRPVVVDLYDPYIIENLHYATNGYETFAHDHATLLRSVERGDFFLCASEIQRTFYLGLMLAVGRLNPERFLGDPELRGLIDLVPFGVPEPLEPSIGETPPDLLFGGIYDWYDPLVAIEAVAIARDRIPEITLTFTTHPNAEITPQGVFESTREAVRARGWDSFVRFEPWVPYEEREAHYRRFRGAIITFRPSIETSLAMRTRVFDFLWGNLPVITSSSPGTDAILRRYAAGIVVENNDPKDLAASIVELVGDVERRAALQRGALEFAKHHQWNALAKPLIRFVEKPAFDPTREHFVLRDRELAPPPRSLWNRVLKKMGGRS